MEKQIQRNVAVHDRIARRYEAVHGEIFNDIEQTRLRNALQTARDAVQTGAKRLRALDFGCGSGNLSSHLIELGLHVTAADVSRGFLDLVRERHLGGHLDTLWIENGDLSAVANGGYDLIAVYSVLHHIPDYLGAVSELARICKAGGVIMIDHESTEEYWANDPEYRSFQRKALRFDLRKYLTLSNYIDRIRRVFNPRHSNEGDIHVWPDDHIIWSEIKEVLIRKQFEVVLEEDYLLNRKLYRPKVYEQFRNRLSDTKVMIFRKCVE